MGILNVTPDSFSDGGQWCDPEKALDRALQMQEEGADLIDVGGESTRPGAVPVLPEEEIKRVVPVLKKLTTKIKIPISIDTRKSQVAEMALNEGASLINDISALGDGKMADVIARAQVPVILMHMKGGPQTMQAGPIHYDDVIGDIIQFLKERMAVALQAGIPRDRILVDPGLGFGKRAEDNWEILRRLEELHRLEAPIVIGASRKSFIRQMVGEDPQDILVGSVSSALGAARRGASILRVHDVRETCKALPNRPSL